MLLSAAPSCPPPDLAPLVSLLAEAIKDVCECEAAALLRVLDDGTLVFASALGGAAEQIGSLQLRPGEGLAGRVLLNRAPEIVDGPPSDVSRRIEAESGYRVRSLLAVPLLDGDVVVGVAEALNPREAEAFKEEHLERLLQMAPSLARAVRALGNPGGEGEISRFYDALLGILAVRVTHLQQRSTALEESRRAYEIHRARRYGDEKMVGLARMAAGIAHEINNPLAVALANVSQLEEVASDVRALVHRAAASLAQGNPAQARSHLEEEELSVLLDDTVAMMGEAHEELSRISQVVSRLMLFGDRDQTRIEEVNLAEETERVCALARLGGLGRHCRVELEVQLLSGGSVKACRTHVRQVLVELLDNALRAAERAPDPAGGRVRVRTFADGHHIHVTVEDNGPGIPFESQERVFDPFYTTKIDWRSTGLGLTAAYGVVRALGGLIAIDSIPGRGSQFTASFPLRPKSTLSRPAPPLRTGRYYEDLR